ncbi:tigger transposable element-derived protein 1-like [Hippocampus zosterae]|uniref:tigger transposable element-derived protein 1-like n=1 Tax=Hippocampus zosterae TaxID=109293 RepID=UPI00223CD154|nr:tigger transposable element-derived protein 1-like [Hippocampus zosterae]
MTSYEENERQQKRTEAVGENSKVLCHKDVRHAICHQEQRPPIKEEAEELRLCYEEEEDQRPPYIKVEVVEADIGDFPQTGASVKSENRDEDPPERSRRRRSGSPLAGAPPDSLLAPLSDSDDVEGTTSDSEGEPERRSAGRRKRRRAKPFRCSVCGQRFLQEKHLSRHARTHTGEILRCPACFKGFLHKHALTKHGKTHAGERAAVCSAWAKGFVQKPDLGRAALAGDDGERGAYAEPGTPDAEPSAATSPSAWEHARGSALPASPAKRPVRLTVEQKKEIVAEHEAGARLAELAARFGLPKSTVCTILKKKASIKAADVAKGVTLLTKQRPQILEDVEKLLLLWVNEQELAGGGVSAGAVIRKAKRLHGDLLGETGGGAATFKASRGWFDNFTKRSGIRSVRHDEDVERLNRRAAESFAGQFESLARGYLPSQVFNCGEAGLFWRKMPKRTWLTKEEKARPGHKPMKDKLTLLLCANASGDCQLKPLLVYHSENPRAFKSNRVLKAQLPVMWRAHAGIRVTRALFGEWLREVFAPGVRTYLRENALPPRCLLVVDKAAAHPPGLEEQLDGAEGRFIRLQFLPSRAARLLRPLGRQLVSHFKKLYTRALFSTCLQVTEATDLTLSRFWRDHFNIFHCIHMVDRAWREVPRPALRSAWKTLWPACLPGADSEGLGVEAAAAALVEDIVSIGTALGLELDGQDVEELLEEQPDERSKELSTKELLELHSERMQSC